MASLLGLPSGRSSAWEKSLLRTQEGQVKKLAANVVLILTHAPEWEGAIAWDEFAERIVIVRPCPAGEPGPWTDLADIQTAIWLQRSRWHLEASPELIASCVRAVAAVKSVHPLRERLNALTWDGVERIDTWTTRYLGAADTEVHREIGKRWLLGAVCRAFEPGSQVDTALILEGEQGRGKSSAARILSLGFFTDELADVSSKDAAMQLHGAWIIELPELDAISRAEASKVKAFLTRRTDRYRAPYGRHVTEHPRQCVFIGTVNHNDWLRDETGGRRFLPVEVGTIDLAALRADVEQIWAEAVTRFRSGEPVYTTDERLRVLTTSHVATRFQEHPWHEIVKSYAEMRGNVSVRECLEHVGVERSRQTQSDANTIAKILKSEGFRRRQVTTNGKREWRYFAPPRVVETGKLPETGDAASAQNQTRITTSPVSPLNTNSVNGVKAGDLIEDQVQLDQSGDLVSGEPDELEHAFADLLGDEDGSSDG